MVLSRVPLWDRRSAHFNITKRGVDRMSFNLIITVAGIGILVGVLASVLNQSGRGEMAQGVTIVGVIVVLYIVVQSISELFTLVKSVFNLY